ncbi:heterogeneous nuclear ribonucleoprotein 1-like [Rutidosis leptorrhynchoides]|uniref:heterogeneous nuclear ribonucleoprotein 1-like n=1 Tax=Rutidosis leptorrhynchoides TaxID=125765 RepID=UPI003A98EB8C
MDSDQGKLFIGGISWETSEEKLKEYFGNYGDILQTVIMRDKITGKPRGFGFVVFSDPSVLDAVLQDKHTIDGRTVEAKRALSREEQQVSKAGNPNAGGRTSAGGGGGDTRTKKIFVGGLPPTLSEEGFRQYFEAYGQVTDVVVMYDQQTNRPRGFGFISFDSEDAVDRVLHKTFHDLNGKQVEVKRALPKDANLGGGRSMGGGGGYQGYGGSSGGYESRMDSNRYMQSQNAPYGNPGYGYGPGNNGMGYNGYGGYGGTNPGYGGPTSAPYGNPNVPSAGYGAGPTGAARNAWNGQQSSGYGGAGAYGNAPWGGSAGGVGGDPQATGPTGQSPSGAAGYGNQGYGYGDGSYGNPSGYGAVGGRIGSGPNSNSGTGVGPGGDMQSGGGSYGGYGDANGYGNSGWRADPSQASGNYGAAQAGYGGYGGGPARQG